LPKQVSIDAVAELKERIEGSQVIVLSKWIGINADQATKLRQKLRDSECQHKVYKNTLAAIALKDLGLEDAAKFMDGPTAWSFSNDAVAPSKALKEFGKDVPKVEMVGGILEGKIVDKAQLEALADLPPKEILLGQFAGLLNQPLQGVLGCFNAVQRDMVNVLEQIRKQKEEQEGAAA